MLDYKNILNNAADEAKDFVNNPSRMDALLDQLEEKLRQVPAIGETASGLPVMIAMVKSWIKKEYEVQSKVLALMAGAFLYVVKGKDLIPDKIPVLGIADDVAVIGLALKLCEKELNEYRAWKANRL